MKDAQLRRIMDTWTETHGSLYEALEEALRKRMIDRVIAKYDEITRANRTEDWDTIVTVAYCNADVYGALGEVMDMAQSDFGVEVVDGLEEPFRVAFIAYQERLRSEIRAMNLPTGCTSSDGTLCRNQMHDHFGQVESDKNGGISWIRMTADTERHKKGEILRVVYDPHPEHFVTEMDEVIEKKDAEELPFDKVSNADDYKCTDCGVPTHYDRGDENYHHDDPKAPPCFLIQEVRS